MKINLFVNDMLTQYRSYVRTKTITNMDIELIKKIYRPEHQYVIRGEITLHPKCREILDIFVAGNYVLMTEGDNATALIGYQGKIPYISFSYDGFMNDQIRNNQDLTYNMMKMLDYFSGKDTQLRTEYIISPHNYSWYNVDLLIMKQLMLQYPKMKQPYFVMFQDGDYFSQKEFTWVPYTQAALNRANAVGLLTQKNLDFLNAFLLRKEYACTALKNEIIIMNDGTVRTCLSHKITNIIGNVNTQSLEDVIVSTQPIRDACIECEYKLSCYLAYHYKDSINELETTNRIVNSSQELTVFDQTLTNT